MWGDFYRPSRVKMEERFKSLEAAQAAATGLQQALRQLMNRDLKLSHNREIASILYENEERIADSAS